MHEYSLVLGLLDDIERLVPVREQRVVRRVHVCIGELAGVDPELFRTAFSIARGGTLCEPAVLILTSEAAGWECGACGPIPEGGDDASGGRCCPTCGTGLRRRGGRDIVLERIELEVSDV